MAEPSSHDGSSLERLEKKLYQPDGGDFSIYRSHLEPSFRDANRTWIDEALERPRLAPPSHGWLRWAVIISAVFFVAALSFALYFFFVDTRLVSAKNIEIAVSGPITVKAGEEVRLQATIVNRNQVALQAVSFLAEFPAGTRRPDQPQEELLHYREELGTLSAGGVLNQSIAAILFGTKNEQRPIRLVVQYRLAGSDTLFEKVVTYPLTINSSPIDLVLEAPDEVVSGQELTLKLTAVSNATALLEQTLLSAEYPAGFQFQSADFAPQGAGNNQWLLGDLSPGQPRVITIRGRLTGQDNDLKAFKIKAWPAGEGSPDATDVVYGQVDKVVTISKPFLQLALATAEGEETDTAMNQEEDVRFFLEWKNATTDQLRDAVVTVKIGGLVNRASVRAVGGFYSSAQNTIRWDKNTSPRLAFVDSQGEGTFNFELSSVRLSSLTGVARPAISLEVLMEGIRVDESGQTEKLSAALSREVKINTPASVAGRALRTIGPFVNTGPWPPEVDQATTYTVFWSVSNLATDLEGAEVRAALPLDVNWTNTYAPSQESIVYDQNTREVIWRIGRLPAATGVSTPREIAFQVSLTPSLRQVGSPAVLVEVPVLRGRDTFTGRDLVWKTDRIDTQVTSDPAYRQDYGRVR